MKKILNIFVGSLLILCLSFFAIACENGSNKSKELKPLEMTQEQMGVYYDLNGESLEVKQASIEYKQEQYATYTYGDDCVMKAGDVQLTFSINGNSITIKDAGTFTKRTLAKVATEKQGVYADSTNLTSTVVVREGSVTLSDKKTYPLFENETGVYYLANGKENYISFTFTATVASISLDSKTYIITAAPLPAEEGELTKLVRKILDNAQNKATADFALEATATASAKQTITSGEKNPDKIDLIGAFLGDTQVSASASINVKNLDLNDLSKLLAEIKLQLTAKVNNEDMKVNVQVNAQDGKVFTKQDKGNPNEAEYSVEDLPNVDDLAGELMEAETFDFEELLGQLAEIEAKLAEIGVKYSDIKLALDSVFKLNENELKISITKDKAQTALLAVQLLVASNLSKILEEVWTGMSERDKAQYKSYDEFSQGYTEQISNAFIEAQNFLSKMTINSCKLEINFNTFATLIDIDIVVPGEETTKDEQDNETVTCTYNTAIKLNFTITPVESKDITKVNPVDYIYSADKLAADIKGVLPQLTLPTLSDNATFKKNVSEYDGDLYYGFNLNNLTSTEVESVYGAFEAMTNSEHSSYYSETLISDEEIKNVYLYTYENKDETGAVVSYSVSVSITVEENTYVKVTPTIGEGITFDSSYFDGTNAWANGELSGSLRWEDNSKVVYVLVNGVVYDIIDYSGDYFNLYVTANTSLEFRLGEADEDYVSISWYGYPFELEGPRYGKAGETLTYTVHVPYGDGLDKANVLNDSETLATNVGEGDTFTFTVPADAYYIYFDIRNVNAIGE